MMSPTYATAAFAAFAFAFATQAAGLPALAAPAPAYVDTVAPGAHLHDLGRTAASKIVHLAFNVRYQHQDELDRDALLINSKGSPLYHHFLTNREWNAYFAPSVTTVRTVLAELRNAGFHVTSVSADRGLIDASARADAVERFYSTLSRSPAPARGIATRRPRRCRRRCGHSSTPSPASTTFSSIARVR
jgi:hypothetical protein